MATTTFSGPVVSQNGFQGNTSGAVAATTLSATGAVALAGANIVITGLPTADPQVVGQLWNDGGVLTVSAG